MNLGIAFQIIDDILDYTQDQSTIGKPAGNDLRQGMVTLPLIYTLQDNGSQHEIRDLLNSPVKREEDIQEIVNWVTSSDGIQRASEDAHLYASKARDALYQFPASSDRDILDELINFVVARNR
jgi:geranylgeranyl pyrophosphate synthase